MRERERESTHSYDNHTVGGGEGGVGVEYRPTSIEARLGVR